MMAATPTIDLRPAQRPRNTSTSRWTAKYRLVVIALDIVAMAIAIGAASYFKFGDLSVQAPVSGAAFTYEQATLAIVAVWLFALALADAWSDRVLGHAIPENRAVITATLAAFGTLAILSYLAHVSFSRAMFMTALPIGCILLTLGRFAGRLALRHLRREGRALTPAIIVGDREDVIHTVAHIRNTTNAGLMPSAVCVLNSADGTDTDERGEVLDSLPKIDLDDVPIYATKLHNAAVAVAGGLTRRQVRTLAWALENSPADLLMIPRLTDVAAPRIAMSNVRGLGLVHVELPRYSGMNHVLKRSFDVVFASLALILTTPVLFALAIAIKLDDGGPIIFRQQRVGLGGQPFTIHKFRTMVPHAEFRIMDLIEANGGRALLFKAEHDPRITRLGSILRRYSLDELPQFWTVLKGQMSIVGPRPQVAREVAEYDSATHRRLLIKPGITGLWQVNGRSTLSLEQSIKLDLAYVENWSLSGDISIIMKTLWVVIKPAGSAY